MTRDQIKLLQQSWSLVLPMKSEVGLIFYNKLFNAAPHVRYLFKENIDEQAGKLVTMLGYIVAKMNRMDELLPEVKKLGARHQQFGAQPAHYEIVGQCLIATLEQGLGAEWTPEIRDAWITAYNTLKNVMIVAQS